MLLRTKVMLGFVGASLLLGAGLWCGLKIRSLNQVNTQLNEELMSAKLEIGKAHTALGDAQSKIKLLDKKLQDAIKARDEVITQYGQLLAEYNAHGGGSSPLDGSADPTQPLSLGLSLGKIYVLEPGDILQPFTPPLSHTFADSRLNAKVTLSLVPYNDIPYWLVLDMEYDLRLKIMAQLVTTIGESGAINNYANIFEVDDKGNKLGKFEITSFETVVEDQRKAKFHWFNPKLDLGIMGAAFGLDGLAWGGSLGISLASYGLDKNNCTWRFLRLGADLYQKNIGLEVSPFMWNLADPLPLVQNLWIGPSLVYDFAGHRFGFGVTLSVSL